MDGEVSRHETAQHGDFATVILENLRRAGVQNGLKDEKMNPDLTMGEGFLKKTGTGNLFMVFGKPDIDIEREGGDVMVTINGVDIYDPSTGQVRPSSMDEIACWFIDTDYDGESFFVRHAYFTGANEPYARLQKSLRAEIDEDAWASLYRTESRPFPLPESGQIAVKVINHFGDEVIKVYDVTAKAIAAD